MQIISIVQPPCRVSTRPRPLLAKASAVWLWPGIPLTERRGVTVQTISPDAIRFWLSKFLGPETVSQPMPMHIAQAAGQLTLDDERAAQHCLDRAGAATLSPEGAMLAGAVAARLGISVPDTPIIKRMALWDRRFVLDLASSFDHFAEAAVEQASGRSGEIATELIDSPDNLVSIPTLKHWKLNPWYQTKNVDFADDEGNSMTPRDYLIGKGCDERRRVGLIGLRTVGVLK